MHHLNAGPPAAIHRLSAVSAALAMSLIALPSHAMEIQTGNPDLVLRWDNTLRYNLGQRVQRQDPAILANPNFDDGDRNFGNHSLIANRLDLLSEIDLVVDRKYGFRVSAAAWGDTAYRHLDNRNSASANTLVNGIPAAGALSPYTDRYARGPSGELLDAFVFGNAEIGEMGVSLRVGKHTVYWGESLLGGGAVNGISYGQYSLDLWKALATPGIEAKELYRPRNSMTLQLQPTPELSIAAQTFFDWESARYPESGSFLTVNDALLHGGDSLIVGPRLRLLQGPSGEPDKTGDFGLSARWSPQWLDGTAGIYGRRTADIQPQLALLPAVGQYRAYYGRDIDIYGLSIAKNIGGMSLGGEFSYRRNMPLQSVPVQVLPAPMVNPAAGQIAIGQLGNDAPGTRGNTMHGVINLLGVVSKTALFDAANWNAELVWSRWLSVSQNPGAFKGSDAYRANPANVDAVSRDYIGLGINFTPTWYQVFPGVDVSMPLSWSGGLSGNSAVTSGGNKNAGSYAIGISADVYSKYNFALRYVGFYGDYSTTPAGAMQVANGTNASLSDRGHVLLTFKATF